MGSEEVTVSSPPIKERRQRKSKTKKDGISAHHIEALTVQAFAIAAMLKNAKHWKVHDLDTEVRPWSGHAADLLNEYVPADMAEKVLGVNAAVSVVVGIATMVIVRMDMDNKAAEQKRRMSPPAPQPVSMEQARQQQQASREADRSAHMVPESAKETPVNGTGAASRHPGKIAGLQQMAPAFSS